MKQDEVVVVRLSGGIGVGRCLAPPGPDGRARIALGRNREARLPSDRIILTTGISASTQEEVGELWRRWEALSSDVDLSEAWEVVRNERGPVTLDELAELYWSPSPDVAQRGALLLQLHRDSLYFITDGKGFTPRSWDQVSELKARQRKRQERSREAASLAEHLAQGQIPAEMTRYQTTLLEHLRGYILHGDNYTKSNLARDVLARIESDTGDPQRTGFELLARVGIFSPDEPLEIERAGIPTEFSDDALAEAEAIDPSEVLADPGRADLTALNAITIDEACTEDRDDALSLEMEEPGLGAGEGAAAIYRIGVHIADAGALIPRGGALDREADQRMATLYLPDGRVEMLPSKLSSYLGSLVPNEDRATLSLLIRATESGKVLSWEVSPSAIRSRVALSYSEADQAMVDDDHPWHPMLVALGGVAWALRRKREEAGAISLERPEMSVKVATSGEVAVTVVQRSTPARTMVTELMILCNSLMADFCHRHGLPAAFRFQAPPDFGDVPPELPNGPLRWHLMMRRLPPAKVDTLTAAHAGLGVPAYIQATSPLRRYPDLVMQRQMNNYLATGRPLYSEEEMASVAQRAELQLKELSRLEEGRRRYWFLKYLGQELSRGREDETAALFQAVVLENQPGRLALMELAEYPFRTRARLPMSCVLGDTVSLRLHDVDLWLGVSHFTYAGPDAA